MQKKTKKLTLNRETLKSLNDGVLDAIAGGCNGTCFCTAGCSDDCGPNSCMFISCDTVEY